MEACKNCPMDAMITNAEAMASSTDYELAARAATLGIIAINRMCHNAAVESVECTGGPVPNQHNMLVCPLQDVTYGIRSMAFGVPQPQTFGVAVESFADHDKPADGSTGQYL